MDPVKEPVQTAEPVKETPTADATVVVVNVRSDFFLHTPPITVVWAQSCAPK